MVILTLFLTIAAVNSFPIDSSDCFNHKERNCAENFQNAVHNSTEENLCSELRKFADCLTDAVDECFGDDRDENVLKNLERLENDIKGSCGTAASGDHSDLGCFNYKGTICRENLRNLVYSETGDLPNITREENCRHQRKYIDCTTDAVNECFGEDLGEGVLKGLEQMEHFYIDICGTGASAERSFAIHFFEILPSDCFVHKHKQCGENFMDANRNTEIERCGAQRKFIDCLTDAAEECDEKDPQILKVREKFFKDTCGASGDSSDFAVTSSSINSRDCFDHKEKNCSKIFKVTSNKSNTEVDRCSELRKYFDCLTEAVDECFGDDRDEKIFNMLQRLEDSFKYICGAVASSDRSDFAVNSSPINSKDCFDHKEKNCSEKFEGALNKSNAEVDTCSDYRKFIDCLTDAVDECFGEDRDEEILKRLKRLEKGFKFTCASSDRSDFDEKSSPKYKIGCFYHKEENCRENFTDAFRNRDTGDPLNITRVEKCSLQRKYIDCTREAVDECFGDDRDEDVLKGQRDMEFSFIENCGREPSRKFNFHFLRIHPSDCYIPKETQCMDNFLDAARNSSTKEEKCGHRQKFIDCLTDSADYCFGDDRDEKVLENLENFENHFKRKCGAVASEDSSDFDENSLPIDSSVCFENSEMDCMKDFVDAIFNSNTGVDKCSELRKFVVCSTEAVDECYGDDHDEKVHKGLEELENIFQDSCGAAASGDGSYFDDDMQIEVTATIKKRKKKVPRVNSVSQICSGERKICWETFESAVIHGVFYSNTSLDKCSVLRHFVLCSKQAVDDCSGEKHDEDADKILEVWKNKYEEFCEVDITDDKSVTVVVPSNQREKEKQEVSEVVPENNEENCMQPKEVGPCRGYFPRWYYDVGRKMCLQFIYGGCRGNKNNFERYADCNRMCETMLRDFFQIMVPDVYLLKGEKCLADNKDYILECIKEASRINMPDESTKICLRWDNMSFCTKERIGERCGEESRGRFIEQFPDMPEEVKTACEAIPLVEVDNFIDLDIQNKNGEQLDI